MKKTVKIILTIIIVILLLGIYRFNFTDDDIYVKKENGDIVKIKDIKNSKIVEKKLKTKNGDKITITELHPLGFSLSTIKINILGNKDTIILRDIDNVKTILLKDLNSDNYDELYIITQSAGSGSYGFIYAYTIKNSQLIKINIQPDSLFNSTNYFKGYMGHDSYTFNKSKLIRTFPIYNKNSTNADYTTKIQQQIHYVLRDNTLVIITE